MKNEVSSSSSSSSPHRSVVVFNKKTNVHIKWIFCMLIKNLKLHFPWCTEQPTNPADRIWGGGASGQKLQQNVLTRSFRVCFYSAGGSAGPARPSLAQVQGQRGCPSRPALAARASFCWMWYSWKRMEILWVIFRYFCRHDSEQLDWNTNGCEDFIQMFLHSHVSVIQSSFFFYLLGLHVSCGEVSDAVHEAVLRHLVVRPQKLLKLNTGNRHSSENCCRAATQQNNLRDDREGSEVQVWEEISSNRF